MFGVAPPHFTLPRDGRPPSRSRRALMSTGITPVCGPVRPVPGPGGSFCLSSSAITVNEFIQSCFTDSRGEPVVQAAVHEKLQAFLSDNKKAIIELPRDHGK